MSNSIDKFIIKRSGRQEVFDPEKVRHAIASANAEKTDSPDHLDPAAVENIVSVVTAEVANASHALNVEDIQDIIERELNMVSYDVFMGFHDYRARHAELRQLNSLDKKIEGIITVRRNSDGSVSGENELVKQENSNKNPTILSVQRDYIAGEWSRHYMRERVLPADIQNAHDQGIIHFHDTDYTSMQMHNCDLVNLNDMLQNGTKISGTIIEPPKSFATACTVMSQIAAAVASSQYGGQSMSLAHIAPFVDVSRRKLRERYSTEWRSAGIQFTEDQLTNVVESELVKEVEAGCQTIQYQLITLHSTNGQAPFITLNMWLSEAPEGQTRDDLALIIRVFLEQRLHGIKDEKGNAITIAFPKLIYVLDEDNTYEGSKYFYLTKLAAKCTAKRMVPDYVSAKMMREYKLSKGETRGNGDVYPPMGCRSFLTPDRSGNGFDNIANAKDWTPTPKYYGRFNQGVVTINLPDVALSSRGDKDRFWEILDERLELCHKALQIRHNQLVGTPSDVAPLLWQDGALARLEHGETIDKLLYGGYSTISLGYAGLYECVKYMTGESHTSPNARPFALSVMQRLNDKCEEWKQAENIDYSVYGTPLESTTYKFAKCLQKRFGVVEGITDHNYITNSYHVCVREKIDAFTKLRFESEFQRLSPGGAISYVEVPNMQDNLDAVMSVIQFIYENIMYAELNTKSDLCEVCGYDGEIKIVEDEHGKLVWECPSCGNRDQNKMVVARRTCGYIGTNFWNQGRTAEINDRVLHL